MEVSDRSVLIAYKNHKGEVGTRVITPQLGSLRFSSNQWHTEPTWLVDAYDHDKDAYRTFAVKDIRSWSPYRDLGTKKESP